MENEGNEGRCELATFLTSGLDLLPRFPLCRTYSEKLKNERIVSSSNSFSVDERPRISLEGSKAKEGELVRRCIWSGERSQKGTKRERELTRSSTLRQVGKTVPEIRSVISA